MAEERRIIRIEGPATTRIRYGRATLTIAQSGGIMMNALVEGVEAYESGEITADKLSTLRPHEDEGALTELLLG